MDDQREFYDICEKNSLFLSQIQKDLIENYVRNLQEWNKRINLVSRNDLTRVWKQHILGSVSFLFTHSLEMPSDVLDLGTGGGLPGIPVSILQPELKVTLLDSIQKKIIAVKDIHAHLRLNNVSMVCGRAEDLGVKKEFKQNYDYILARAVAPIVNIIRWSIPLLRKHTQDPSRDHKVDAYARLSKGSIIMLKGGNLSSEIIIARRRYPSVKITNEPILIKGLNDGDMSDKRIVIAQP